MPIDPNIALSVRPPAPPTIQPVNPLDSLAKVLQIQTAQAQQPLIQEQLKGARLENQQRGIELQENQGVKDAITKAYQSGGDLTDALPGIMQASPTRGAAIQKTLLENKKAIQDLQNSALEHDTKSAAFIAQQMASVTDQDSYAGALASLHAAHIDTSQMDPAYDPTKVAAWVQKGKSIAEQLADTKDKREAATQNFDLQAKQKSQAQQELSGVTDQPSYDAWLARNPVMKGVAPPTFNPQAVAQLQRQAVPIEKQPEFDIAANKAKLGITGNDDFETVFLPAYAQQLGKTIPQLTPQEKMQSFSAYAQAKSDPEVRASLLASRNTSEALKQLQLNQMPTPEQAAPVAQDIINHRLSPEQMTSMFGGFGPAGQTFKRMVYAEAKKIDPQFNFEQASSDYQYGKSAGFQQTVRYMDSVQNSIPQLQAAADALNNGSVRSINALVNAGKNQFNNIDLKKFQADRTLVGDEIAKILQGGGTGNGTSDAKLKQAQDLLSTSDSPAAIATTLKEVTQLIGYRRDSLTKGTYMDGQRPQASANPAGAPKTSGPVPDAVKALLGPPNVKAGIHTLSDGSKWMKAADGTVTPNKMAGLAIVDSQPLPAAAPLSIVKSEPTTPSPLADQAAGFGRSVANGAKGLFDQLSAIVDPHLSEKIGNAALDAQIDQWNHAKQEYSQGNYANALRRGLAAVTPILGPFIENTAEKATSGKPGAITEAATDAAGPLLFMKAIDSAPEMADAVSDHLGNVVGAVKKGASVAGAVAKSYAADPAIQEAALRSASPRAAAMVDLAKATAQHGATLADKIKVAAQKYDRSQPLPPSDRVPLWQQPSAPADLPAPPPDATVAPQPRPMTAPVPRPRLSRIHVFPSGPATPLLRARYRQRRFLLRRPLSPFHPAACRESRRSTPQPAKC